MLVLGIETSCDETSTALVENTGSEIRIIDQIVSSQIEHHRAFGGVVPEIATRQHLHHLEILTRDILSRHDLRPSQLGGCGITRGPGLASSLLIGMSFGKAFAMASRIPWVGVNHLEGHLFSPFLALGKKPFYPHVGLVVSGGHTLLIHAKAEHRYERLGSTLDDAAGEAFDKAARLLNLPYPGGPQIEALSKSGNPAAVDFPRGMLHSDDLNFSFSGLKTSVRVFLSKNQDILYDPQKKADVCASFQQAVIDVLVSKSIRACKKLNLHTLTVSGGVSCNQTLRKAIQERCDAEGIECLVSPPNLSTDNASMIAAVASSRLVAGEKSSSDLDIDPNLRLTDLLPTAS